MKKQLALAIALAVAPFAALAGDLSFNYIEAGYAYTDIDDIGDGDGAAIAGSFAINDNIHAFARFSKQEANDLGGVDLDALSIGVGYNRAIHDNLQFVARASLERNDLDSRVRSVVADARADGYAIEAGVRGAFGGRVEGWLLGGYGRVDKVRVNNVDVDGDDLDDNGDFFGRAGVLVKLTTTWGVVAESTFNDDSQQLFAGVRASF